MKSDPRRKEPQMNADARRFLKTVSERETQIQAALLLQSDHGD